MKAFCFIIGLCCLTKFTVAQSGYYQINGHIIHENLSINDVAAKFYGLQIGEHGSYDLYIDDPLESKATGISMVVYEKLSGKALYIVANKTPSPGSIKRISERYGNGYHQNFRFYADLSRAVDDSRLTKSFITRTLGNPVTANKNEWEYPAYKLKLFFTDSVLTSFIDHDYSSTIEYRRDKFTGRESYSTPIINHNYTLAKTITNGNTSYFCEVYDNGLTEDVTSGDVLYFLFTDNSVLKIAPDDFGDKFVRFYPSAKQVTLLSTKVIKGIRIGSSHIIYMDSNGIEGIRKYLQVLKLKN